MSSETIFLQSTAPNPNQNPNFANAQGSALFFNYSQASLGSLTDAQTDTLVKGGLSVAIAEAAATFFNIEPTFSTLFTNDSGIGSDGAFVGSAKSQTKVVANFAVGANQTFSFDFSANLSLSAKEIENRDVEFNQAKSKTNFLVLDTTNPDKPKVLDYFGIRGKLISSKGVGDFKLGSSRNISIINRQQTCDINGNNGQDSLTADVVGRYQKKFKQNTNITIVEINASDIAFLGDTLIDNLGEDVIYGTIRNDKLRGSKWADKIYGSLGDDWIDGKKGNDILEGGQGNDSLNGGEGNDKLHGGWGNDVLVGGRGSDVLVGGDGNDQFVFESGDSLLKGDFDVIQDFEFGIDKIAFQGWGEINSADWLNQMFSQGQITDTTDGVLFDFNTGTTQGKLLLSDVTSNLITSESIVFI
jgi:serralysin